jgi:hypothetical protein
MSRDLTGQIHKMMSKRDLRKATSSTYSSREGDFVNPLLHASRHQTGGVDQIKLDSLGIPDNTTDLNATVSQHGLLPKLSGVGTEFFAGDGTFTSLSAIVGEKGKLDITGNIAATTVLTTNASGANFTKSGDSVNLGVDAAVYSGNHNLHIFLNGNLQDKQVDAVYVSAVSFYLDIALNNGDAILIFKK